MTESDSNQENNNFSVKGFLTYENISKDNGDIVCKITEAPNIKFKYIKVIKNKKEIKKKNIKTFNRMILNEGTFCYVPDKNRERETILYLGKPGSGKSYQINEYLKEFVKEFPGWPIYMFSEKESTSSITVKVNRIKIDKELKNLKWSDFENSCCVFDDIDSLTKELKVIVYELRDQILNNGREKRIHVLMSNHNNTDGNESKVAINCANVFCVFMANYNRSMKYLLENYIGLEKDQITKLKNNNDSRATYFLMTYPNLILQDNIISTIADF